MTPSQQALRVLNAVDLGWQVPDEHCQGYAIAELREIDMYQVFWLNETTLQTGKEWAADLLEAASDAATIYIAEMG